MTVRTKLFLLLFAVGIAMVGSVAVWDYWLNVQISRSFALRHKIASTMLDSIMQIESERVRVLVYDYTYWDDMVSFAVTGDQKWADVNLKPALPSYGADMSWVYNKDAKLVNYTSVIGESGVADIKFPGSAFSILLEKHFVHFFINTDDGLLEIRGATIHPSDDPEHTTPPQGFFLVGRMWDHKVLGKLSSLSGGSATLTDPADANGTEPDSLGKIKLLCKLPSLTGTAEGMLVLTINDPAAAQIVEHSRWLKYSGLFISIALFLVIYVSLIRLVLIPLKTISAGLASGSSTGLKQLERMEDEFGRMARLVSNFFVQRTELLGEIRERITAQTSLLRLSSAIDQAGDAVMITDVDGVIVYVNPEFERMTGYGAAEALGRSPNILKSDRQDAEFYRKMWETVLHGEVWKGRITNRRKDDSLFEMQLTITPVKNESGTTVNFISVSRDITEQVALEEQFRQAQKMESVGRLAGGIAHDFNNLLTPIIGYSELLLEGCNPNDRLYEDLDQIRKAGLRAKDLIRQMLAFSRKQILETKSIDLGSLMEGFLPILKRTLREDIKIELNAAPTRCKIKADPSQIEQIIMNLSVNAQDAMPMGGKLEIKIAAVDADEEFSRARPGLGTGRFVLLSVSDTGSGMSEEVKLHIFEPFYTTKAKGAGTGLGLATVYGIVKQHGGALFVESELGKGTTFELYFPAECTPGESAAVDTGASENAKRGTETILVTEDNDIVRKLACAILRAAGYMVLEAVSPSKAVEIARDQPGDIHLLLTDVVMPDMNGKELYEKLEKIRPSLRVVYMSGYTEDVISHHGVLEKDIHFVQKPFSVANLSAKVREALDD